MRRAMLIAVVALMGCDKPEPTQFSPQTNSYHEQLKSLPLNLRNAGLRAAIYDSGARCLQVVRSRYQQDYKGSAMWTAHCSDSGDFAVFVTPTGFGQVLRCRDIDPSGPACKLPIKDAEA